MLFLQDLFSVTLLETAKFPAKQISGLSLLPGLKGGM